MATFTNANAIIADTVQSYVSLYSATSATVIHAIYISNNSIGSNAQVTMELLDNTANLTIPILDSVPLRANTTLVLEKPINLKTNDSIRLKSVTGCAITAFASVMVV
jgi:hypothetical protein